MEHRALSGGLVERLGCRASPPAFAPRRWARTPAARSAGPAAYCGIVGLKPTYGRVSRRGVFPLSYTLDHCGPLTRTVEDCAIMMQALAGYDPADPASAEFRSRIIGRRWRRGSTASTIGVDPPFPRARRGRRFWLGQCADRRLYCSLRRRLPDIGEPRRAARRSATVAADRLSRRQSADHDRRSLCVARKRFPRTAARFWPSHVCADRARRVSERRRLCRGDAAAARTLRRIRPRDRRSRPRGLRQRDRPGAAHRRVCRLMAPSSAPPTPVPSI